MAVILEMSPEQQAQWDAWVSSRPPLVRAVAEKCPPNRLFLCRSTGQRVVVSAYAEDGTVRMVVLSQFNALVFHDFEVFGIDPADLVECDLPSPDEPFGFPSPDSRARTVDHPADDYQFAREKLSSLTDGEVDRIASGRMARDANPALLAALRAELARRGLKVRPDTDSTLPCPEDEVARLERGERIRSERF